MPAGKDLGFFEAIVEVGREVDGVLVDVSQHFDSDAHQARFGVPIRGRRIAIDGPEVSLPVNQRITQREILRHAHQRVVHAAVAVRMISTQHVTNDGRALLVRATRQQAVFVHGMQHAAVHRLESVSDVGQRAGNNHAHRIIDERFLDLLVDETRKNTIADIGTGHVAAWAGF